MSIVTAEVPPHTVDPARLVRRDTVLHVVLIVLAGILATRSMWGPALLAGHSAWIDLIRMVEFDDAWRHGDYLPTWSPDLYFGHGSPLFQFYAPFCYYLAEAPVRFGADYATALKVTQLVALIASGLTFYRFATSYFSASAACVGSLLYTIAPYRFVDIYIRHALAEHCAFIWLPLIVLGTEQFATRRSRSGLLVGALSVAGLVFTHNVMALIALPVCVLLGFGLTFARPAASSSTSGIERAALAALPAILGVGLVTFFWWPAMSGRPLTQAEASLTGGYYDFHRHFVPIGRFFAFGWDFGESGANAVGMPLQIGLPHIFVILGAVWAVFRYPKVRVPALGGLVIFAGAVFACTAASTPFWEHLPLIKYTQFPWRFLGLAIFGAAICGTASFDAFVLPRPRIARGALLASLVAILGAYYPYFSQSWFVVGDARTQSVAPVTAAMADDLSGAGVAIFVGSSLQPAQIRAVSERATASDDFLPRGVTQKPSAPAPPIIFVSATEQRPASRLGLNHYAADLHLGAAGVAQFPQFWFPGWQARVDGAAVTTHPVGPQAIVACPMPAGDHRVEFFYTALPQRQAGIIVSLVAWVVLAATLPAFASRKRPPASPSPSTTPPA